MAQLLGYVAMYLSGYTAIRLWGHADLWRCGSVVLCARFCDGRNSVLSDSCWLQAAASGDLALFAFDAAAAAPRDSLVAALGMMAQAAIVSIATVSTTAIVSRGTIPIVSIAGA